MLREQKDFTHLIHHTDVKSNLYVFPSEFLEKGKNYQKLTGSVPEKYQISIDDKIYHMVQRQLQSALLEINFPIT
jgi:delta-aminolevulinic acid dehydratase/porphobilinogen synthase